MTEPEKEKQAAECNRLMKLRDREQNSPAGSRDMVWSYEASMARIEERFQRADSDISDYI